VHDGIAKGAVGINLGRNVWQCAHPVAMAKALRAIVHDQASVKQAHEIFKKTKENK
jgi:putative autoinducer-2 (AI-2) aldolase